MWGASGNLTFEKHPHLRGEDESALARYNETSETPPPAWGRRTQRFKLTQVGRNTPTCVGKTRSYKPNQHAIEKHPHLRGEDASASFPCRRLMETPPPAWGRHLDSLSNVMMLRNTPTCVGKTPQQLALSRICEKHPHLRGEDSLSDDHVVVFVETPPPAWGRRVAIEGFAAKHRNTPTCVGKTRERFYSACKIRKHPHLRGEDPLN